MKDFQRFLCSKKHCQTNTANKYLRIFRAILNEALRLELIDENPYRHIRISEEHRSVDFLTSEELEAIRTLELCGDCAGQAQDLFVFACFTGLSYSDVKSLTASEIKTIGNQRMIYKYRQKTSILSRIPLLKPAQEILQKYEDHKFKGDLLLPIISNQKLNAHLKEIALKCGIAKKLTFHMARHTFATTICLGNGVRIESLSQMLGHAKITTTMIYAHLMDDKIIKDAEGIRIKYG